MASSSKHDWRRVRLGDVLEQVNRFEQIEADREYRLLGVKWYAEGVFERERKLGKKIAAKSLNRVETGDFLYNRLFAWKGSFAVVMNGHAGGYVSGEFPVFRVRPESITAEFLYHYFSRPQVWERINHQSTGTTNVSRNRWKEDQFLSWYISLPSIEEQEAIINSLRAANEAIQADEDVLARTREFTKALSNQLLTRGIPKQHTHFKNSPIGTIPEAWEVCRLGELLINIEAGKSPKCEGHPAELDEWGVLKVSAISSGQFLPEENKVIPSTMSPIPTLEVQAGDVLVVRANGAADLVGRAVYVKNTRPRLMISDKTLRLIPKVNRIDARLLPMLLDSEVGRAQIKVLWGGSSGQKNISQMALQRIIVPVPPISEQHRIAEAIYSINCLESETQEVIRRRYELRRVLTDALVIWR